ncbi:MAG: DMT family transporter [Candidatus Marsarchaeota archaeon]|jgi:drug/metabolite transporter (DMT)-like permease|nr:DMT family transporter [Candidatus Marsarchaeota archaeon]
MTGIIFGIISMLSFGFNNFLVAIMSRRIGAFRATFWFQAFGSLVLLALSFFLFQHFAATPYVIALILLVSLVGVLALLAFMKGLEVGNVPVVATVSSGWSIVTVLLSVVLLGEGLAPTQTLAIALAIAGTLLLSYRPRARMRPHSKKDTGLKYAFMVVIGWGLFYFLLNLLVRDIGWFTALFITTPIGFAMQALYGVIARSRMTIARGRIPRLAMMGAINVAGALAFDLGVTYNYAAIVAPITAAAPLVVVVLGVAFLKERLMRNQTLGIALVITGLILLSL